MGRARKLPDGVRKDSKSPYYQYFFRYNGEVYRGTTRLTLKSAALEFYNNQREKTILEVESLKLIKAQSEFKALQDGGNIDSLQLTVAKPGDVVELIKPKTVMDILSHWMINRKNRVTDRHINGVASWFDRDDGWKAIANRDITSITNDDYDKVHSTQMANGVGNVVVNQTTSALSIIVHHARRLGELTSIAIKFERLPEPKRVKRTLTLEESQVYINTAIRICEIDQVIAICMMIGLGLRGIEALNAVWCGFKRAPDGGLVYHVMRHKSMNKGDCEPRIIAVSPWLEQLLVTFKEISSDPNYIRSGRMGGHKHRVPLSRANLTGTVSGLKEDFLIPAIDGLSRTNNYIGDALKCINEEIGISGITPHCLRATYADQLNINGLNINDLRISLGHANLATTQRYLNQNLAQSREHQNQIGQKIWPINPGEVLRQLDVGGNTLDAIEGQKSLGLVKANKRAYPNGPAAILLKPRPRSIPAVSDEDFFPTAKFGSDIIDAEIIMPDLAAVYCQRQPGPSLLSRLVWEIPATIIGEIYGVSDVAVAKWCKKAGIKRPTPGYWAKVAAAIVEIKSADANSPVPSPIPGINLEM